MLLPLSVTVSQVVRYFGGAARHWYDAAMHRSTFPAGMRAHLEEVLGSIQEIRVLPGGDIHRAYLVETATGRAFVKVQAQHAPRILTSEAEGLRAMAQAEGCRVPEVYVVGEVDQTAYLAMEYIEFAGGGDPERLAEAMASLHELRAENFGWEGITYLGRIAQPNGRHGDAGTFYVEERLHPHIAAAEEAGSLSPAQKEALLAVADVAPRILRNATGPVLVHGDPWGGNHAFDAEGSVVFFDPSPAWSFSRWDIGFARGFGAYSRRFYEHYDTITAVEPIHQLQEKLGELILMLVHQTMFGMGYATRVNRLAESICRDV